MTRDEILNLKAGDKLSHTMDVVPFSAFTKLKPGARYSSTRSVLTIDARGTNSKGKVYVIGYTDHGTPGSGMSFSIVEDEVLYRLEA
jgi:hypothetical protein